jgi:hypothetical protein
MAGAQIVWDSDADANPPALLSATSNLINVGTLSQDTTVRIYDQTDADESVLTPVVIRGASGGFVLRIVVVAGTSPDPFVPNPVDPVEELPAGLASMAGIRIEGAGGPNDPDTSLRDRSVLALAIEGDLTGDVTVAQIWRLDVRANQNGTLGGNVTGNITVRRGAEQSLPITTANFPLLAARDLRYLGVAKSMTGNVTVLGWEGVTAYDNQDGGIENIVMGTADGGAGWLGDIDTIGSIISLQSNKPIGGVGVAGRINISADYGIGEIRTLAAGGPTPSASINANIMTFDPNESCGPDDGKIWLIRSDDDIQGSILTRGYGFFKGDYKFPPEGINGVVADGVVYGDITVVNDFSYADIVASSILGTISIGTSLKGSIIAHGPQGHINSISIGRSTTLQFPIVDGFHGSDVPPRDQIGNWYLVPASTLLPSPTESLYRHSSGSLIKAKTIGTLDMYTMGRILGDGFDVCGVNSKRFAPVVEAEEIGSLSIERYGHGSIWSGRVEGWQGVGNCIVPENNNKDDDYTVINNLRIGCMARQANLVAVLPNLAEFGDVRGISGQPGTTLFYGDVGGSVFAPSLDANSTLRIGGGISSDHNPQGCYSILCTLQSTIGAEQLIVPPDPDGCEGSTSSSSSPRFPVTPTRGRIDLRGSASLNGQIILHANAPATQLTHDLTKWQGDIVVGAGFPNPIIFNTDPSTPLSYRGPEYTKVPTAAPGPGDFGSGAIGLVPFAVHRAASQFDETCIFFNRNTNGPFGRAFNYEDEQCPGLTPDPLEVEYYGPVAKVIAPSGFQQRPAVDLTLLATSGNLCAGLADASWAASTTISANQRRVSVSGSQFYWFPNGKYGYKDSRPSWGNTGGLRCDKLLTSALVRPLNSTTTRYFSLFPDCDSDCQKDTGETTCPPGDPMFGCDDVDFNNDGSVFDPTDVDAFLSVFSEGPCVPEAAVCNDVDFNNDGAAFDPCDVDSFLVRFAEGPCTGCGQ